MGVYGAFALLLIGAFGLLTESAVLVAARLRSERHTAWPAALTGAVGAVLLGFAVFTLDLALMRVAN